MAAIIAMAFCISRYWYQLLLIRGDSMEPAYHNLELTVIDKHHRGYGTGEVIAFWCEGLEAVLVKRIAAGGGDTVQVREGRLYVNGEPSRVYPGADSFAYAGLAAEEFTLPAGTYFVIGDNIPRSRDSRYEEVGLVREEDVLGKVME